MTEKKWKNKYLVFEKYKTLAEKIEITNNLIDEGFSYVEDTEEYVVGLRVPINRRKKWD